MSGRRTVFATPLLVVAAVSIALTAACSSVGSSPAPTAPKTTGVRDTSAAATTTIAPVATIRGAGGATFLAHDEAVVAALAADCKYFMPPGQGCKRLFDAVQTADGEGGTLSAIELNQTAGDGYGRGAVYFFRGEQLLPRTAKLPPQSAASNGVSLDWVAPDGLALRGPGEFAVSFVVSSGPNLCTACVGNDGTDTYVFRWDGSAMVFLSGTPPPPPAVIGEGP